MARKKKEEILAKVEPVVEVKEEQLPDTYILRVGETLEDVSKKFGVPLERLRELNEGSDFFGGNQVRVR